MKRVLLLFLMISFSILSYSHTVAQDSDYKFHTVFIYNFTKYIQWPAEDQSGDFVIGVLGNSPIAGELEKMAANKTVGMQKIVVKKLKSATEATNCHILFLPGSSSEDFDAVQEKLKGKHTLIITEKSGMAKKGSGINFVMQDNKWKFELNESSTQRAGLKVAKELSRLAITV